MDEYADWAQYLVDATDPARAQKEFEERIEVPFSLRPPGGSPEDGRQGRAARPAGVGHRECQRDGGWLET